VDAILNGLLPSVKPAAPPPSEPTGINFIELLKEKADDVKDHQE
jgi:hypothetical protein